MTQERTGHTVLLLGGAGAGKTTLLIQLLGRIQRGTAAYGLREAPSSLVPVQAGFTRLARGLAVQHTARGTNASLALPVTASDGTTLDIVIPDYAGEDLTSIVQTHAVTDRWRGYAQRAAHWLLLIRLSQHIELPDILSRPIGEIATHSPDGAAAETSNETSTALPADLWAVELLQMLLFARGNGSRGQRATPRLTLLLSCWDELGMGPGVAPEEVAAEKLPLLHNFCLNQWVPHSYSVLGLSAQGHALSEIDPADDFVDAGPHEMGWLITQSGDKNGDLTLALDA